MTHKNFIFIIFYTIAIYLLVSIVLGSFDINLFPGILLWNTFNIASLYLAFYLCFIGYYFYKPSKVSASFVNSLNLGFLPFLTITFILKLWLKEPSPFIDTVRNNLSDIASFSIAFIALLLELLLILNLRLRHFVSDRVRKASRDFLMLDEDNIVDEHLRDEMGHEISELEILNNLKKEEPTISPEYEESNSLLKRGSEIEVPKELPRASSRPPQPLSQRTEEMVFSSHSLEPITFPSLSERVKDQEELVSEFRKRVPIWEWDTEESIKIKSEENNENFDFSTSPLEQDLNGLEHLALQKDTNREILIEELDRAELLLEPLLKENENSLEESRPIEEDTSQYSENTIDKEEVSSEVIEDFSEEIILEEPEVHQEITSSSEKEEVKEAFIEEIQDQEEIVSIEDEEIVIEDPQEIIEEEKIEANQKNSFLDEEIEEEFEEEEEFIEEIGLEEEEEQQLSVIDLEELREFTADNMDNEVSLKRYSLSEVEDIKDEREESENRKSFRQKYGKYGVYSVPVRDILNFKEEVATSEEFDQEVQDSARIIQETLEEFKINADVTSVCRGPAITLYELLPARGVKLSKITELANNFALRLAAARVRIVAPIPGRHTVGIEVPNRNREVISFAQLHLSKIMENAQKNIALPVALGKDIRGNVHVINLTKAPHLLIAGATGSGKSVLVNSLISSLISSCSPHDLRLMLIDPKIVELKLYDDIPHLLTPVITDTKKAIQAIQWCVGEMENRYALLDAIGVRDITTYNQKIVEKEIAAPHMPFIVLVVDEFADLMAVAGKSIEGMIARLAAMSRAVGIHIVLATQRPSVDVITGLIKANFPSRIACMVASKTDSRVIIDSQGAEQLLGQGDMLFTASWNPELIRLQGAFLSENDIEELTAYIKSLGSPEYIDNVFTEEEEEDGYLADPQSSSSEQQDPLYNQALETVLEAQQGSASFLQRKLGIGYNRAAKIIEQMEDEGIVGPANGSKPREVLI